MGGFHGGHSSGGSSHGSFHGSRSHSSSSSYNRPVRITYIHNGRTYYKPDYGTSNGKPMSFLQSLIPAIIFIVIGVCIFLNTFKVRVKATITKTSVVKDEYDDPYEVYDFEYSYRNQTYTGYGDDDVEYHYEDGNMVYTLSILEGEVYDLYVSPIFPSNYAFSSEGVTMGIAFTAFLSITGCFILFSNISKRKKFKQDLQEIGDVNNDGKLDEKDMEMADAISKAKIQGEAQAVKENTYDNLRRENSIRYCEYCGAQLDVNDKFCPNCGSSRSK